MKLVRLYEEILRENQAEACVAKFGKELFDPELNYKGEPSNVEPNTELEKYYLFQIDSFTVSKHGKRLKPEFVNAMNNLRDCVKSYPEILEPEGRAFRGSKLTLSELLLQYEDISDDLDNDGEFTFTYKPKSVIQSWTSSLDVAMEFAAASPNLMRLIKEWREIRNDEEGVKAFVSQLMPELDNYQCPIILKLNTSPDDFLFKAKYFSALSQHEDEMELIRFNDKPKVVTGIIFDFIFKPVYEILTAVKKFQAENR